MRITGQLNFDLIKPIMTVPGLPIHRSPRFERLQNITKEGLVAFGRKHYGSYYVSVYKAHGVTESEAKIQKPLITPDRKSVV